MTLLTIICLSLIASGAPIPGMGTSVLSHKKIGIPFHTRGYKFELKTTAWEFTKVDLQENKDQFSLEVPGVNEARIEVSELSPQMTVKNYTQKWNKDYYHFGFEILGKKDLRIGEKKVVLIDLFHRKEKKHMRQMIISRTEALDKLQIMVVTCTYEPTLKDSIKNCNDLGTQFSWISQKDAQRNSSPSESPTGSSPEQLSNQ